MRMTMKKMKKMVLGEVQTEHSYVALRRESIMNLARRITRGQLTLAKGTQVHERSRPRLKCSYSAYITCCSGSERVTVCNVTFPFVDFAALGC